MTNRSRKAQTNQFPAPVTAPSARRATKVAIEIPWGRDSNSNALYQRYLAGTHTLDRTEMQQLGFRIARLAGLPRVYGVDYSLRVNTAGVMVQAHTSGQPALAGAVQHLTSRLVAEADSLIRHATVGEILTALNSARADSAHGIYMPARRSVMKWSSTIVRIAPGIDQRGMLSQQRLQGRAVVRLGCGTHRLNQIGIGWLDECCHACVHHA